MTVMEYGGWVYIMANKPRGIPYTGVTADIAEHVHQHKTDVGSKFCKKYNIDELVYTERYERTEEAIAREKAIKAWKRSWKIELIEKANPNWDDLSSTVLSSPAGLLRGSVLRHEVPAFAGMTMLALFSRPSKSDPPTASPSA